MAISSTNDMKYWFPAMLALHGIMHYIYIYTEASIPCIMPVVSVNKGLFVWSETGAGVLTYIGNTESILK